MKKIIDFEEKKAEWAKLKNEQTITVMGIMLN